VGLPNKMHLVFWVCVRMSQPCFESRIDAVLVMCFRARVGSLSWAAVATQLVRSWCTVLYIYDWQTWW